MTLEMCQACTPLIAKDVDLEWRIRALVPESYVQYCRALVTEARLEENNDLVLIEGCWEDEFPF